MSKTECILKALADENRLRIILLLTKRKMCVCELAEILDVSQPAVSRHLSRLKAAGLIADEQDSFWTNYRLASKLDPKVREILKMLPRLTSGEKQYQTDLSYARKINRTKLCRWSGK